MAKKQVKRTPAQRLEVKKHLEEVAALLQAESKAAAERVEKIEAAAKLHAERVAAAVKEHAQHVAERAQRVQDAIAEAKSKSWWRW